METIRKQVARAWRLMWAQTILNILSWVLIIAFSVCFVGLLVPKFIYSPYAFQSWAMVWLASSGGAALLTTFFIAWFYRPSQLTSAVEIDRRFKLRERCSSALALDGEDRETAIGQALMIDAQNKVERIDVRDEFRIRPAPTTPWVALPLAACLAMFWVPDAAEPEVKAVKNVTNSKLAQNVKEQIKPLVQALAKSREKAENDGDQEAVDEFKKLEKKAEDLQKMGEVDKKKLISDINEIKEKLEERKKSMTNPDMIKKALDGLKDLDKGPADKMADAMKEQNFEKASQELGKLIDQMRSGNMTAEQQKQLEKQISQMKESLEKAQAKIQEAKAEAKRELDKAEREGNLEKAAAIRKKLEKMEGGEKQEKSLANLQAKMDKAQQAMKNGDKKGAAEALQEMQEELGDLGDMAQSAEELDQMMEDLDDAKESSNCEKCNGKGCKECQGKNGKNGQNGQKGQKGKGKGGDGDGEAIGGSGDRDEKEAGFKEYDDRVRGQLRKGETVMSDSVAGPNRKGISREEAREAVLNAKPDDPDAIESISLPKAQRDQQKEYFDSIRKP